MAADQYLFDGASDLPPEYLIMLANEGFIPQPKQPRESNFNDDLNEAII